MPLCLSILHVVYLVLLVYIYFHSALMHLPAWMRSFILQLFAYFLYSASFSMFSSPFPLLFSWYPSFFFFPVTYTSSFSLSKQKTLEATDVSFFSRWNNVHNKPFQVFLFLFVSAATVTSNLLQAERTKPMCAVRIVSLRRRHKKQRLRLRNTSMNVTDDSLTHYSRKCTGVNNPMV